MIPAIHEIYTELIDVIDVEGCMGGDGESYESSESPGDCGCRTCALHRISDKLFAIPDGDVGSG